MDSPVNEQRVTAAVALKNKFAAFCSDDEGGDASEIVNKTASIKKVEKPSAKKGPQQSKATSSATSTSKQPKPATTTAASRQPKSDKSQTVTTAQKEGGAATRGHGRGNNGRERRTENDENRRRRPLPQKRGGESDPVGEGDEKVNVGRDQNRGDRGTRRPYRGADRGGARGGTRSDRTGHNDAPKKDGHGKGNWGTEQDELQGETEPLGETTGDKPAQEDNADKNDSGVEMEEEKPIGITFQEWKEKNKTVESESFNIRKPNEDKKLNLAPLKKSEDENKDSEESIVLRREPREKHIDISVNFASVDRGFSGNRGNRDGFRGRGRGDRNNRGGERRGDHQERGLRGGQHGGNQFNLINDQFPALGPQKRGGESDPVGEGDEKVNVGRDQNRGDRGTRRPYRGADRSGARSDLTGHNDAPKKDGHGKGNWGTEQDELQGETNTTKTCSTLSLHIAAYDSSIEGGDDISESIIEDQYETPRQRDHEYFPEVMQFKASQKLLIPSSPHGTIYPKTKADPRPHIKCLSSSCDFKTYSSKDMESHYSSFPGHDTRKKVPKVIETDVKHSSTPGANRRFVVAGYISKDDRSVIEKNVEFLNESGGNENVDVIFSPPRGYLSYASRHILNNIMVASQNMRMDNDFDESTSANTEALKELEIHWVILGHSERRHAGETDILIAEKTAHALKNGINVIFCIGETLDEREARKAKEVNFRQLQAIVEKKVDWSKIVIAYEPVWAKGRKTEVAVERITDVHKWIREFLKEKVSDDVAAKTRIIYGGSVTADNAAELGKKGDIDGFLVGGASLKPDFVKIINARG